MYEWLISDAKLPPAEFAASFDDVLNLLPSNAHVLDCSCGTGQLAVGLAGRGMQVVATDASEAMVRRTAELSEEFGAFVRAVRANWEELPDHFQDNTFDMLVVKAQHLGLFASRRLVAPEVVDGDMRCRTAQPGHLPRGVECP
ncbi:class I SAM-dependent methyltransferase [Streptomyces phaeochromogenes]|uniref:class I SAM-dependent methyltransferase n=1 Tax=Streptomyces phaeochromogenes TaxID=1923 RepID=UPI00386E12F2|nr:class I SAM-dependent methyltransferase [Streptomyces phaeochromogenes]